MAGRDVTNEKKRKRDLDEEDVRGGRRDIGTGSGSSVAGDDDQKPPVARVIGAPRFYDGSDAEANRIMSETQRPQFFSPAKYQWVEQFMAASTGGITMKQAGTEYDLWMYHQQLLQRAKEMSNTVQSLTITSVSTAQTAVATIKPEPIHSLQQIGYENNVDPNRTVTDDDDEVQEIGRKYADGNETTVINPPTQVVTSLRRPKPEPGTNAFPTMVPAPSVAFKRALDTTAVSTTAGTGIDFTGPATRYAMPNAGETSSNNTSTAATVVKNEPELSSPRRQQPQPQVPPESDRECTDNFMRTLTKNMGMKPLRGPQPDVLAQIAGHTNAISASVRKNGGIMKIPKPYATAAARALLKEALHVGNGKSLHIRIRGYGDLLKTTSLYERGAKGGEKLQGPLILEFLSEEQLASMVKSSMMHRRQELSLQQSLLLAANGASNSASSSLPHHVRPNVAIQPTEKEFLATVKYDPVECKWVDPTKPVENKGDAYTLAPLSARPAASIVPKRAQPMLQPITMPSQPPIQPSAMVPPTVAMQHQPPTVPHPFMPVVRPLVTLEPQPVLMQQHPMVLQQQPIVMQQPAMVIQQQPGVLDYPFMATVPPPNTAYPPPPLLQARNRAVLPPFEQMNIAPINGAGPSTTPKPVSNEVIQFGTPFEMLPVQNPCPAGAYRVVPPSKAGGMASSRSRHHLAPQPTQQPVQAGAPVMEVVPVPMEQLNAEACAESVFKNPDNRVDGDSLVFQDWKNIHNRRLWEQTMLQGSKLEVCETSVFTLKQRGMGDYNVGLSEYVKIPYAVYAWDYPTSDDPSQYMLAQQLWNVNMAFNPLTFPEPADDTVPPGIQECRRYMRNTLAIPDGGTNWLKSLTAFLSNLRKIERNCLGIMSGFFQEMGGLSKRDLIRFVGWIVFNVQRIVSTGMTTCRMVCAEYSPLITLPLRQQHILDGQHRHIETNDTDQRRYMIPRKRAAKLAMETRVFTTCSSAERNQMEQAGRLLFDLFQPRDPPSHETKLVMIWEARKWTEVFDDLYARHPDLSFHIREMIRINPENQTDRDLHALIMKRD